MTPPVAPALVERSDRLDFVLPPELEAHEPPEARGFTRDDVRLLVSTPDAPASHARFRDIPAFLAAGDLVVVNTSATMAAAVGAHRPDGQALDVHFSTRLPADLWLVEPRTPAVPASLPFHGDVSGETLSLAGGGSVDILARFPGSARLWVAALRLPEAAPAYLARNGRPIRYGYVGRDWPVSAYQTVYGTEAGSAEMPSAGRPFTAELITALVARGVGVSPVVLHAGVSSLEDDELPPPEYYRVPVATASRVNATRAAGGRIIAIGTTVVRALETVADELGAAHPGDGWTDLVVTPSTGVRVVDGLLTGWHEPRASHLLILEAVAGRALLEEAYAAALAGGYLWHEFGDLHLILPAGPPR